MDRVDIKLAPQFSASGVEGLRDEIEALRKLIAAALGDSKTDREVINADDYTRFTFSCSAPTLSKAALTAIWAQYAPQLNLQGRCTHSTGVDPVPMFGQLHDGEVYTLCDRTSVSSTLEKPSDQITVVTRWVTGRIMSFSLTITVSGENARRCFCTMMTNPPTDQTA